MCTRYQNEEFCNLCAHYISLRNRRKITEQIKEMYLEIYGEEINLEDYAPSSICASCASSLKSYVIGESNILKVKKPAKWGEYRLDHRDCFFHNVLVNSDNYRTKFPKNSAYFPPKF